MDKPKRAVNPIQRYIKQLISELGDDYLNKILELRNKLIAVMSKNNYTTFKVSICTGLYIDTIDDFMQGRNNISLKTYKAIKTFVNRKNAHGKTKK
jgi:hypothetical protein